MTLIEGREESGRMAAIASKGSMLTISLAANRIVDLTAPAWVHYEGEILLIIWKDPSISWLPAQRVWIPTSISEGRSLAFLARVLSTLPQTCLVGQDSTSPLAWQPSVGGSPIWATLAMTLPVSS
jgi:hypothetical protein